MIGEPQRPRRLATGEERAGEGSPHEAFAPPLRPPREVMKRTLRNASIVLFIAASLAVYAALVIGAAQRATSPPLDRARRSYLTPEAAETLAMYSDPLPPSGPEPVRRPARGQTLQRRQRDIGRFSADGPHIGAGWVRPGHPELRAFCAEVRARNGGLPPEHPRFWLRQCLLEEGFDPCTREGAGRPDSTFSQIP